jgi:hypothetical protein
MLYTRLAAPASSAVLSPRDQLPSPITAAAAVLA